MGVQTSPSSQSSCWCYAVLIGFSVLFSSVWLLKDSTHLNAVRRIGISQSKEKTFACPRRIDQVKRNHEETFEEYLIPTRNTKTNLTDFLDNYREREFDAWERSYTEVLEGMRHWKTTRIVPNVQSGDKIYESACGIGLNLLLTLELLHEHGISGVHLYGNEVLSESAELAVPILDHLSPTLGGQTGLVCEGDSTNLSHVPSNYFDLVWCGYMSELYDPLGFFENTTISDFEVVDARHRKLCRAEPDDWKSQTLLNIAVERTETWYSQWVGEMIRIAKPGKAVIIEQVTDSRCADRPSFLGIKKSWWSNAIHRYRWDVDPDSLDFEKDELFSRRYHVFMRKRP